MTSPKFGIPFVAESQAQANVTHNEAVLALQVLATGVDDYGINSPPGSPADGDAYIVGTSPTGAWAGRANCIAYYMSGWRFIPGNDDDGNIITMGSAQEGLSVFVRDENQRYTWTGNATSPATLAWRAQGVGPFLPLAGGSLTGPISIVNSESALNAIKYKNLSAGVGSASLLGVGDGSPVTITQERYSANTGGATNNYRKARGSEGTPGNIVNGDTVMTHNGSGYSGAGFTTGGSLVLTCIEPTPSSSAMAMRYTISLAALGSATVGEVSRFTADNGLQMYGANTVIDANRLLQNRVYTVATLPTGVQGRQCYASDLRVFNGAGVQEGAGLGTGGTVVYNGTAWKIAGTNVTAVA